MGVFMKNKAVEYFKNGYSCSESIILACADAGLCEQNLLSVATAFSGGMSSGCLCGAVAGAQMVLGSMFGKSNSKGNEEIARAKAKDFIAEFKKRRKATCCKVLTNGLDFGTPERKQNCAQLVEECTDILESLVGEKVC